jgi:hypothetical protein
MPTDEKKWFVPAALILLILTIGAIDARFGQMSYMSDGVSYLDISHSILTHQWHLVFSTFWGLGYPLLIALFRPLFAAGPVGEWIAIHFTDFFIFCATLASFLFLTAQIRQFFESQPSRVWRTNHFVLALTIFLGMQLTWDRASRDTPDLLVSCIAFLATALLVRLARRPAYATALLLGLTCGFGYVAKAIYLPFSLICIFIALPLLVPRPRRLPIIALAAVGFAALAAPYIAGMSWALGVFTTGEAGPLNVAWMVNGLHYWTNWQGGPAGYGQPLHPTHLAMTAPNVYTYGDFFPVTYPPFFNPPYFYLGFRHFFSLKNQVHAFLATVFHTLQILVIHPFCYAVAAVALLLYLWRRASSGSAGLWRRIAIVALPSAVAILLYMLININARYISGFLSVVILLALTTAFTNPALPARRLSLVLALLFVAASLDVAIVQRATFRQMAQGESYQNDPQWKLAAALAADGLHPGDKVAVIFTFDPALCSWAHFAQARIVGETQSEQYWSAPPQAQQQVFDIYRKAGAILVVADKPPAANLPAGWTPVPQTTFFLHKL